MFGCYYIAYILATSRTDVLHDIRMRKKREKESLVVDWCVCVCLYYRLLFLAVSLHRNGEFGEEQEKGECVLCWQLIKQQCCVDCIPDRPEQSIEHLDSDCISPEIKGTGCGGNWKTLGPKLAMGRVTNTHERLCCWPAPELTRPVVLDQERDCVWRRASCENGPASLSHVRAKAGPNGGHNTRGNEKHKRIRHRWSDEIQAARETASQQEVEGETETWSLDRRRRPDASIIRWNVELSSSSLMPLDWSCLTTSGTAWSTVPISLGFMAESYVVFSFPPW